MNDPIVYMMYHGWRRLLAKAKFLRDRYVLKKLLNNDHLGDSIVVSERTVEIPLAIDFLNTWVKDEPVMELGCVLPYYVFKSSNHIVYDLMDDHPASMRKDIRDIDVREFKTNIVSISTIEHISRGDYGIDRTTMTAVDVLHKIRDNAKRYFVTFPMGLNNELDEYIMSDDSDDIVFLTRKDDDKNDWYVVQDKKHLTESQKVFGGYCCANTICVVSNCLSACH